MIRTRIALASAAAAAIATFMIPGAAQAANGTFYYTNADETSHTLVNSHDHHCHEIGSPEHGPAVWFHNRTNRQARLFHDADCWGHPDAVAGQHESGHGHFASVMFVE